MIFIFAMIWAGSARGHHGPGKTRYCTDIRARHAHPKQVTQWMIYLGPTPMVNQTPAWTIPAKPGLGRNEVQLLRAHVCFNRETWVQIGIQGPRGLSIEPQAMLYPHRHPCAWYAARDRFPAFLGLPDLRFITDPIDQQEFWMWLLRMGHVC